MPSRVQFRPEQEAIVNGYEGGKLGISAVPGSGKTFTLSHLAARLIEQLATKGLTDGVDRQEILVVTFTNTAVNSFRSRIAGILQRERGLLPYIGYRVRTLHGLAHDIVRERPSLVGLSEDFQIIDERVSNQIIADIARNSLDQYTDVFDSYLGEDVPDKRRKWLKREKLPELATRLGLQFIKNAKNNLRDPLSLRVELERRDDVHLPLAAFGLQVYEDYQRSLSYRGVVDFDDLVRLAIVALHEDPDYCARLQTRWPFILEDEAQDSSRLQEEMLRLLSRERNWVRVGDPNQAINTTFTTADPRFLREFLQEAESMELHTSGRSALPVIDIANRLMKWATEEHPVLPLRDAFLSQAIEPTAKDDPKPNPATPPNCVYVHAPAGQKVTPEKELDIVAGTVERFLQDEGNRQQTIAALVPENSRGFKLAEALKQREIPYEELLRSTTATRVAASRLRVLLAYLCNPLSNRLLSQLYQQMWVTLPASQFFEVEDDEAVAQLARILSGCREVERLLWPTHDNDFLQEIQGFEQDSDALVDLARFRGKVRIWLEAATLPVDQLILTLAQDLFDTPSDIALGHKIAVLMRGFTQANPEWRLPDFLDELRAISENERKFIGFDDVEQGYEPEPGKVTIATMHAAKGLEWDRVYLLGVSNYGFPSAQPYDNYLGERWFIRDGLNVEAEMLAQFEVLHAVHAEYHEGLATTEARLDYAAERLRLLYVGITRAQRNLMITWNMGRFWERGEAFQNQPALPLVALREYQQ